MKAFTLAYTPCPNDTFLFYHFVKSQICEDFSVQEYLLDVEELNQAAENAKYDITKLSFAAYLSVQDKYEILSVGSALGRGCGPLLLTPKNHNPKPGSPITVLSPGRRTTARLLFQLYQSTQPIFSQAILKEVRYDQIIPKLQSREGDFGIVIHEERFTYQDRGMEVWQDLGEWWEKTTQLPIPLGCIAIRKSLVQEWKERMENCLRKSLDLAWSDPSKTIDYILTHSQNKDPQVVQAHIDLYVNSYTRELGEEGYQAIQELKKRYESLTPSSLAT